MVCLAGAARAGQSGFARIFQWPAQSRRAKTHGYRDMVRRFGFGRLRQLWRERLKKEFRSRNPKSRSAQLCRFWILTFGFGILNSCCFNLLDAMTMLRALKFKFHFVAGFAI